jgi:hypothetical protein
VTSKCLISLEVNIHDSELRDSGDEEEEKRKEKREKRKGEERGGEKERGKGREKGLEGRGVNVNQ